MNKHCVFFFAFVSIAMPDMAKADDWNLTPGKGTIVPDKVFSDQLYNDGYLSKDCGPWNGLLAVENPEAVPTAGKSFISSDQRFSVKTTIVDREFYFVIKDLHAGLVTRLTSECFPVLTIEWSPDSKSILAVTHASETSFIQVIHWNGSRWRQFEIDAPEGGDNDKFHVVNWEFKTGYIEATYIVDHRSDNGGSLHLYRCTFDIDATNGKTSEVVKTPITRNEFLSLRNRSN